MDLLEMTGIDNIWHLSPDWLPMRPQLLIVFLGPCRPNQTVERRAWHRLSDADSSFKLMSAIRILSQNGYGPNY